MRSLCLTSLADRDVQTETRFQLAMVHRRWYGEYLRRGVVVLKEVEVGATSLLHLVADSLASRAGERGDQVGVARRDGEVAVVLLDPRSVVVGRRLTSSRLELGEVNLAVSAEGVVRGLKLILGGEQEDQTAGLSRVRRGDIEVEDGRDGGGDGAEVLSTVGGVGSRRVDGDDQVRVLIVAREIGGAAGRGRLGSRARRLSAAGRRGGLGVRGSTRRLRSRSSRGLGVGGRLGSRRPGWLRSRRARGLRSGSLRRLGGRGLRGLGVRRSFRRLRSRAFGRLRVGWSLGWLRSRGSGRGRLGASGSRRPGSNGNQRNSTLPRNRNHRSSLSTTVGFSHIDGRHLHGAARLGTRTVGHGSTGGRTTGNPTSRRTSARDTWSAGGRSRSRRAGLRRGGRSRSRARTNRTSTRARAGISCQLDVLAASDGGVLGGVKVQFVVVASLAGNKIGVTVVLQLTRGGDGETRHRRFTQVTLELRGIACQHVWLVTYLILCICG